MSLHLPLILLAFLCELVDSSLGMGYGTTLTPLLLIMGYDISVIVPSILFSEFITGIMAGIFHHEFGNTNLRPGTRDFSITVVLTLLSIVGVIIAVFVSVSLPPWILKAYIGLVVLGIGLGILLRRPSQTTFTWKRMGTLGVFAAFNKGISGGGYGPLVTGGQVLTGVEGRNAIAIASMAEGITSAVGVIIYWINGVPLNPVVAPSLLLGAVLSVPLAAFIVSKIPAKRLTMTIGGMTTLLGSYTLIKILV